MQTRALANCQRESAQITALLEEGLQVGTPALLKNQELAQVADCLFCILCVAIFRTSVPGHCCSVGRGACTVPPWLRHEVPIVAHTMPCKSGLRAHPFSCSAAGRRRAAAVRQDLQCAPRSTAACAEGRRAEYYEVTRQEFGPITKAPDNPVVLDFEKPLVELDQRIHEARSTAFCAVTQGVPVESERVQMLCGSLSFRFEHA